MTSKLDDIIKQLKEHRSAFDDELNNVQSPEDVEGLRIKYLGRKGIITGYFSFLGQVPADDKPRLGKELNIVKGYLQSKIKERSDGQKKGKSSKDLFDATLPGIEPRLGRRHPLTLVLRDIKDIFKSLGFVVVTGPELETDYYNFEALNLPKNHPARDLQDTLYIGENLVMRTHTSPVQVRTMEKQKPPIRMISPGRVFRRDTIDASHYPTFHQVEGLCVDEGISFADLIGVISAFARKLLGDDVRIRVRPSYFPFTEPSAEYDISCTNCGGKGCRVCKGSGWLEISGAGMVNPAVFKHVGYDTEKYTGYAFGMGVDRIAMLRYQIDDIRILYENDVRFLQQF